MQLPAHPAGANELTAIAFIRRIPVSGPGERGHLDAASIGAHGGTIVKRLPAGAMLAFPTASAAVTWAATELANDDRRELSIGLAAGDVTVAEDDRFGLTVIEASRLCNEAAPGQGLAARPAVEVAGVDSEGAASGVHELKGLGGVHAVAIPTWAVAADGGPSGTRRMGAILVTDLVGSTGTFAPLSREQAEALRREHFGTLRDVSSRNGGREIANLGDGLVIEFPGVGSALDAAVAMHRALQRHNRRADVELDIRISVAAGELTGNDDWDEVPIARSMELQSRVDAREIVVDRLAIELASDRARTAETVEETDDPEARFVPWSADHMIPLQASLGAEHRLAFHGRVEELAIFEKAWRAALAGETRALLVSGDAGIGKSRFSKEIAQRAFEGGGIALVGRCDEELSIPYQPFVEILQHVVAHLPESVLADYVAEHGGALVHLIPQLADRVAVDVGALTPGIDDRHALFEAIAGLLETLAALEPTVLVLEDLHWADPATALLLKHLVRSITDVPMLLVGNFRPIATDDGHPMAKTLVDLRRERAVERLDLVGLDGDAVLELMTDAAGHELDDDIAALAMRIHHECGGNPFMVNEILLHLVETGAVDHTDGRWRLTEPSAPLAIPASVRDVLSQRIARLSETTQSVLRTAAVIGMAFDYQTLVEVAGENDDLVLDALDDAVGAALLWDPSDFDGRFSFGHAVFHRTLYEQLGPTRRARFHRKVAEQLEQTNKARAAELARHWRAAGAVGDPDKVRRYSQLAGDAAFADLAYEDAVRHYEAALEVVEGDDEATRLDLLLDLGAAQRAAGVAEFTPTLREAAAIAQRRGDPERVARAALGASLAGTWRAAAGTEVTELVELLQEALDAIGDDHPELRARLLAQLAAESYWASNHTYTRGLLDEALVIAREAGDPRALAEVLSTRLRCLNDPDNLEERLAVSTELIDLVEPLGEIALKLHAAMYRGVAVFEAGQLEEWWERLRECEQLAQTAKQPFLEWRVAYLHTMVDAMRDTVAGEASAERAFQIGTPLDDEDVFTLYATAVFVVRWHQGRTSEFIPTLRQLDAERAGIPVWRAVLALALAYNGDVDEARSLMNDSIHVRRAHEERDHVWWGTTVVLIETAYELRHIEAAEALLPEIAPFADHVTCCGLGTASTGSAARSVAMLESMLGRLDDANRHFEQAHEMHRRLQADCITIRTIHDHVVMLLERDAPGDRERAEELLVGASERAGELGMARHAALLRELEAAVAG